MVSRLRIIPCSAALGINDREAGFALDAEADCPETIIETERRCAHGVSNHARFAQVDLAEIDQ